LKIEYRRLYDSRMGSYCIYQNGFSQLQRHTVGGEWDLFSCIWGPAAPIEAQMCWHAFECANSGKFLRRGVP